jgi:protein ImuB
VRPPRDTSVEHAFAAAREDGADRPAPADRSGRDREPTSADEVGAVGAQRAAGERSPQRIACLLVPALALAAELRADPELRGRPLAIVTLPGPRGEVIACTPEAERAGVRVGSGVVHARAACAGLALRALSPAQERAARGALLDAALGCAPRAELAPPASGFYAAEAAVFVDARGVESLYRSEAGFATALAARAERLGLPAVVAIASARGTALLAARRLARGVDAAGEARSEAEPSEARKGRARSEAKPSEVERSGAVQVIPPGGDAAFLAPLALDLLNPEDALADALSRFGLRRVGDLLRVPERALLNRLGPGLLPLLALARGEDAEPPPRAPETSHFEEASQLEAPVAQLEPLLFVLRGLLARLAERLAARGLAFGELTLDLALEGGGRDVRTLGLAAPTLDVRVVLRLAALALEAAPPGAAIDAVSLATPGAALRGDQLDFFAPAGPAPTALSRTLAELSALCGEDRVGAPALADAHRPDAFVMAPFALPQRRAARATSDGTRASTRDTSPSASRDANEARALGSAPCVRALRPPLAAAVQSARGVPHRVQSALANGEVLHCAGPWRTTGRWWSEERYAFDHFDVQTSDGHVFRLRLDLLREHWEIDGVFD